MLIGMQAPNNQLAIFLFFCFERIAFNFVTFFFMKRKKKSFLYLLKNVFFCVKST